METPETSRGKRSATIAHDGKPIVSIVIPAFNEASRIGVSLENVDRFIRNSPYKFEVIVVDDGSTDDTPSIVRQVKIKDLRLIENPQNQGKGFTVRNGVLAATGDYVLFTDADLSAPIEELTKLIDVAMKEGVDVVIGSRAMDRTYIEKHQSRFRELGGIAFNLMVRTFLWLPIQDTQCGFKLFHRQRSRRIFERQTTPGFGFDPELLFLAKRYGLKIREVPVRWSHAEGSKVRFMQHATVMFLDLLRIRWNALSGKYR